MEKRKLRRKARKAASRCSIPDCGEKNTYYKAHAFDRHVPPIFSEFLDPADKRVYQGRVKALQQAATWMLEDSTSLQDLMAHVGESLNMEDCIISPAVQKAMCEMCKWMSIPLQDQFSLSPINSPAALIFWKVPLFIASRLTSDQRNLWFSTFTAPLEAEAEGERGVEEVPEVPASAAPAVLEAYDSHFHLDRLRTKLHLRPDANLQDVEAAMERVEPVVRVVGAVANFCDPVTYPRRSELSALEGVRHLT